MSMSYLNKDGEDRTTVPVGALRRFIKEREQASKVVEHCELCSELIPSNHHHLLNLSSLSVICACQACSVLFNGQGAGGGKYKLVPKRYMALLDFRMSDEQWEEMMIPVNMVYIFQSTQADRMMAYYPSPAGPMESLLDVENWALLSRNNPILREMEPDVEALLINRIRDAREYYIVPIDACYKLVGLIRAYWKGLSGGEEVWKEIEAFFADIRQKSDLVRGEHGA
jgi:Family of unknown function (DUF5947)